MVKSSSVLVLLSCSMALLFWFREELPELWTNGAPFEVHGHRGALGALPPGNTLASFEEGVRQGASVIECDLRLTKDETIVAGHDASLAQQCETKATINQSAERRHFSSLTSEQLQHVDCHPELPGVQSPPELNAILDFARRNHVGLNLELKPPGLEIATLVSEALTEANQDCAGCLEGRVTVQSFRIEHLEALRTSSRKEAFAPRLSFLSREAHELEELLALSEYVDVYSPKAETITPALVHELHQAGMALIPWTVNRPQEMCELARLGVDGLITDFPERARLLAQSMREDGRPPQTCSPSHQFAPGDAAP